MIATLKGRVFLGLNLALLVALVWLAFAVWQERAERDALEKKITSEQGRINELRRRAPAREKASIPTEWSRSAQPVPNADKLPKAEEKKLPLRPEQSATIERLKQRRFRADALHSYAAGFEALKLPPEVVSRAKDIIVATATETDKLHDQKPSLQEFMAPFEANLANEKAQLIAVMGQENFEQLEAYNAESSFDWTMGTDLWDGGAPLNSDQLHQLSLATVRVGYQSKLYSILEPTPEAQPDANTHLSRQDNALLAACSRFLTVNQQEILRQSLIDENRYNDAMRAFAEKQRRLAQTTEKNASP